MIEPHSSTINFERNDIEVIIATTYNSAASAIKGLLEQMVEAGRVVYSHTLTASSRTSEVAAPGWSQKNWSQIPKEQRSYYWRIHFERGFIPSEQDEGFPRKIAVSDSVRQSQREEMRSVAGIATPDAQKRFERLKSKQLQNIGAY